MTNDKTPSLKLGNINDAEKNYVTVAKNYFAPKPKGASLSLVKKVFLWVALLMSFGIMLPQLTSERKRQEVAQEIIAEQGGSKANGEISVPSIHSDDGKRNNGQKSDSSGGQRRQPVEKIKSIDLRVQNTPPPGSETFATLMSGGANGMVKAQLLEDLVINSDIYAAKNSILIGTGSSTEQRLFIKFSRIVSPEGKSKKVSAQAYDFGDHIRGLVGKKVSDRMFKIAASSALIFLGGVADSLQDNDQGIFGAPKKSLRDAALGGVAQATTEHGKRYLDELDKDNQIEVKRETQFVVIFEDGEDKNE